MNHRPIYIVGVGRSGTSLLQSIIATHSEVKFVPETSFLRRYVFASKIDNVSMSTDSALERVPRLKALAVKSGDDRNKLKDAYNNSVLGEKVKSYVLDKDPRLIEYIPLLLRAFPESKILVIKRDPRDVLASKKKAQWSRDRSLFSYLLASHIQLSDGVTHSSIDNVLCISYEKLLMQPSEQISHICEFLGLKFEIEMLNFQETAKKIVQKDELSWKKETFQPININNQGKWKHSLTSFEAECSLKVAKRADNSMIEYAAQEDLSYFISLKIKMYLVGISIAGYIYTLKRRFVYWLINRGLSYD